MYEYYNLVDLIKYVQNSRGAVKTVEGWVPIRPCRVDGLKIRFKRAWLAFTGQCDLVKWPGGQ